MNSFDYFSLELEMLLEEPMEEKDLTRKGALEELKWHTLPRETWDGYSLRSARSAPSPPIYGMTHNGVV
jgi:hypothetical protein